MKTSTSASRDSKDPESTNTIGIRIVRESSRDNPVGRDQYQQLLDFDQGKPRPGFQNALKTYYAEVLECKSEAETKAELYNK